LKYPLSLRLLILSNIISGLAQGISMLAIPWYFASILKSPSSLGLMYTLTLCGSAFWGVYAGTLIDKYPRKKIFIWFSLIGGSLLMMASATGYISGTVPVFMVVIVFAATWYYNNIYFPTMYAFAQEVCEVKDYGKVNSFLEIQSQATTIASGGIAALLLQGVSIDSFHLFGMNIPFSLHITPWSLSSIFLTDGITYFIAVLLIMKIKYTPHTEKHHESGSILERLKTGANFLKGHPSLLIFGVTSLSVFVVVLTHVILLMPIYVKNHLNQSAGAYAMMDVYYAIGALLAGVGIRQLFRNMSTVKAIIILMLATVGILLVVTFTRSTLIFFAFSFIFGITNAGTRVLRITYLFHHVPNPLIGRVNSTLNVMSVMCRILLSAIFSFAFFLRGDNIIWTYFFSALFILINMLLMGTKYKSLVKDYKVPGIEVI
jgi:MFS transporter, DHA3 family, macrolide efflux protein